ncbi:MAG: hypothetical protein R3B70_44430 [Polyangiaceae bacterium]
MLTVLSDKWMTPVDVYCHESQAGEELQQWFLGTGDLFTDYRLRDDGLGQLSDAPALSIAGIEVYAPSSPRVIAEGGRLVRL